MYDPIPAHEDAHARKLEAYQDSYEKRLAHFELEIKEVFAEDIRKTPPYKLCLPYVRGADMRPSYQQVPEAVSDMVSGDPMILQLLMYVLHASDCPMVDRLRTELGKEYAKMWADVLASLGE